MIKTEQLSKVFYTEDVETTALNNASLYLKESEFSAIMGPTGCGKPTLLNIIGLLNNLSKGKYYFNGKEVASY
ncbi:ATP-binding cassette domain-containing protein [Saccharicrinis aurantiacus]|uniref:ATP-binding cassette domain-containing protein n=1 Tax=Saccharicrinis aurantiacus TaxID=1849719 RepID=UPI0009FA77CA|nr:ATP-binding cassette domain-containing protein [Saccharicrinis aurantiacus]